MMHFLKILLPLLLVSLILSSCGSTKRKNEDQTLQKGDVSQMDFTQPYMIWSEEYGTETTVTIDGDYRVMSTNALPNHTTGTFLNPGNPNTIKEQPRTIKIPLTPKATGKATWAREPGVAINGVKFEPETAERFVCETGEVYRIEAFNELIDMGLDHNHAHVQPTGAYHYHGAPTGLIEALYTGEDLIHVGYAHDGYKIFYSYSGQYQPSYRLSSELRTGDICSYNRPGVAIEQELKATRPDGNFVSDWTYVEGAGQLDECNGREVNGEYAYFVTDEYPYMSRCLKGEFANQRGPGGGGPGRGPEGGGPPPGGHGGDHPHGPHGHADHEH